MLLCVCIPKKRKIKCETQIDDAIKLKCLPHLNVFCHAIISSHGQNARPSFLLFLFTIGVNICRFCGRPLLYWMKNVKNGKIVISEEFSSHTIVNFNEISGIF